MKKLLFLIAFLICNLVSHAQVPITNVGTATGITNLKGLNIIDTGIRFPTYLDTPANGRTRTSGNIIRTYSTGDTLIWQFASNHWQHFSLTNVDLQTVLQNGNVGDTGIHLIDYVNPDIVTGTSANSSFVSRLEKYTPTEYSSTVQLNDKWILDTNYNKAIYSLDATPIFQINDSLYSGIRYSGIISNINVDSAHSKGYFKSAWMFQAGGHFGYPGARVQHYAGYVAHNPVFYDTCDYCYGMKIAGFDAPNFTNSAMLALGLVSATVPGKWGIYMSQHVLSKNYLGSSITMVGLPTDILIDPTATLQTTTFASTGLARYTTDLSGSLTSLSFVPKVYVDTKDSLKEDVANKSTSTALGISNTLYPSQNAVKTYVDAGNALKLDASGWTNTTGGKMTAPTGGSLNGTNGVLDVSINDTASSGNRAYLRLGLNGSYSFTSGNVRGVVLFGAHTSSSGSAFSSGYTYSGTLNRTGTSTGIDRAFEVSPTITSVTDFRGVYLNYNNGNSWGNYQNGALVKNYYAGETLMGSSTDAGAYQLQVTGAMYLTSAPTSAGTYDALVRNTSTSAIESIPMVSSTYTPTLTGVSNITASTAYVTGYYRIGNTVTVFGKVDVNATLAASTATELGISLPIASNMTGEQDLGGTGASDAIASLVVRIKADATNDRASFVFKSISLTNDSYNFSFSYQVK